MSLTKITESVIERFSKWFNVNSTTGAVTSVIPDLMPSNSTLYPSFACRAWVNFDGTRDSTGASNTNNTNRFIRGSGNVSSVLRNGTGDYTITFTTAMPDVNYSAVHSTQNLSTNYGTFTTSNISTSKFRIATGFVNTLSGGIGMLDWDSINVVVFR